MKFFEIKIRGRQDVSAPVNMGAGSWTIVIVLTALLAVTFVVAYMGWTAVNDTDVPASGYVAMAIGILFSLVVGVGLMALVFYSSRKGYDEPPVLLIPANANDTSGSSDEVARPHSTTEQS